jgi:hypothetical protein
MYCQTLTPDEIWELSLLSRGGQNFRSGYRKGPRPSTNTTSIYLFLKKIKSFSNFRRQT